MEDDPKSIQFLTKEADKIPAPTPAAQHIPDWLKHMPADVVLTNVGKPTPNGSLKRCMPFVDAMTCGYVLPIAATVLLYRVDERNIDIVSPEQLVSWQSEEEYPGAPFAKRLIIKFRNPWVVQTPPGYSTLFLPMLNQLTMPFQVLAGLVETDTYYNEVYFPSICLLQPGEMFELKCGTPIVQAIPIKREAWKSDAREIDPARLSETKAALKANHHLYREANWKKKTYR